MTPKLFTTTFNQFKFTPSSQPPRKYLFCDSVILFKAFINTEIIANQILLILINGHMYKRCKRKYPIRWGFALRITVLKSKNIVLWNDMFLFRISSQSHRVRNKIISFLGKIYTFSPRFLAWKYVTLKILLSLLRCCVNNY